MNSNNSVWRRSWFTLALAIFTTVPHAMAALEPKDHPELQHFIDAMAENHGFATAELQRLFRGVSLRSDIIEAIERPKEGLPWHDYKKLFLTENNVRRGAAFWKEHTAVLARAQERYGVPAEIIVAILGIETRYGKNTGNHSTLDALTTLMLGYPPRSDFFQRELEEFLLLAREIEIDPRHIKGSYAGAMGWPQFISSSYRRYAVDFDEDGHRDLLDSPDDAIGSIANYLKMNGWEENAPITDAARVEGSLYFWVEKFDIKPKLTLDRLKRYGITPLHRVNTEQRAALIVLEEQTGPLYRLGYNNFYVITRYNRSKRYAMAVYELGEMLRQHRESEP